MRDMRHEELEHVWSAGSSAWFRMHRAYAQAETLSGGWIVTNVRNFVEAPARLMTAFTLARNVADDAPMVYDVRDILGFDPTQPAT